MTTGRALELHYFFDPFCGCYASAPALAAIDGAYPGALRMMPSGLFADDNARPTATMADHAWRNDTRISELTGQRFTEAYRDAVLLKPTGVFDSGPATRALVALGEMSPGLEPKFLHAIQIARYVNARDTALPNELASVAQEVAAKAGFSLDPAAFALRLTDDKELAARTGTRITDTQALMARLSGRGVPQLLVTVGGRGEVASGAPLYSRADHVLRAITEIETRLKMTA
jgi:putative protein-disulfide isomerase